MEGWWQGGFQPCSPSTAGADFGLTPKLLMFRHGQCSGRDGVQNTCQSSCTKFLDFSNILSYILSLSSVFLHPGGSTELTRTVSCKLYPFSLEVPDHWQAMTLSTGCESWMLLASWFQSSVMGSHLSWPAALSSNVNKWLLVRCFLCCLPCCERRAQRPGCWS